MILLNGPCTRIVACSLIHASALTALLCCIVPSDVAWGQDVTVVPADSAQEAQQLQQTYDECVRKAIRYLTETGVALDGSYHRDADPGVTALVTTGLLRQGLSPDDARVARSLEYLKGYVRDDGGIYRAGTFYANYETSLGLMCFVAANQGGRYDALIANAKRFLTQAQWDKGEQKTTADTEYGGAGYGKHKRPDLSNTQFMIDALMAAGDDANSEAIQRALVFVSRCQNLVSEHNALPVAAKNPDGGFYYSAAAGGVSEAGIDEQTGGLRSYGSMTYAGLKSLIYAGLTSEDPRVKAATAWIASHYDLNANPGMGDAGLYYYYHTFAKCLEALGEPVVTDPQGVTHNWRKDLIMALAARQRDDGAWVNSNERWMEANANLATGYALLALSYAKPSK